MTVAGGFGLTAGILIVLALFLFVAGEESRTISEERRQKDQGMAATLASAVLATVAIWLWVAGI